MICLQYIKRGLDVVVKLYEYLWFSLFNSFAVLSMMTEQTLHSFLDTIDEVDGIGLLEYRSDTKAVFLSRKSRQILGIQHDYPVTAQEIVALVDEPFRAALLDTAAETIAVSQSASHQTPLPNNIVKTECSITTPQGKKKWIRFYRKHSVEAGYMVSRGYFQDITAEVEQRIISQQFQDLYDNAPYGYHTATLDGVITNMNTTMRQYLGYEAGEIRFGTTELRQILTPESYAYRFEIRPKLLAENIVRDMEIEYVCKDGVSFFRLGQCDVNT